MKSEAQELTDYLLRGKPLENVELVFSEYKFEHTPKKLNITWTKSKWSIFVSTVSNMKWSRFSHESGIHTHYFGNYLLDWFSLQVWGRFLCFLKGVDFE